MTLKLRINADTDMTIDQRATALIDGGMYLDHDGIVYDDERGDTDVLRLNPPEGMLDDDLTVFEKDSGDDTEWEYVTPGYGATRLSPFICPDLLGWDAQAVLTEVARRLNDAVEK